MTSNIGKKFGNITTWSNMGPDCDCKIERNNRTGAWSIQRFKWNEADRDHVVIETMTGEKARLWIARNTEGALIN